MSSSRMSAVALAVCMASAAFGDVVNGDFEGDNEALGAWKTECPEHVFIDRHFNCSRALHVANADEASCNCASAFQRCTPPEGGGDWLTLTFWANWPTDRRTDVEPTVSFSYGSQEIVSASFKILPTDGCEYVLCKVSLDATTPNLNCEGSCVDISFGLSLPDGVPYGAFWVDDVSLSWTSMKETTDRTSQSHRVTLEEVTLGMSLCTDASPPNVQDTSCIGDLDGDGTVGSADMAALLGVWGECSAGGCHCLGDLDCDGMVQTPDLSLLLGNWGDCD